MSHLYPGVSVEDVRKEAGWNLRVAQQIQTAEPPTKTQVNFTRSYDATDVILRRRHLFESIDFASWSRLAMSNWNKHTRRT